MFHYCYEGNRVDMESFQSIVDELAKRLQEVVKGYREITIVYDTGNNSDVAIEKLDQSRYHFISSLPVSRFPDLLEVEATQYKGLEGERFKGVRIYRQEREVFGTKRTVVVVFSESFYIQQLQTVLLMMDKATKKLKMLQGRLSLWEKGIHRKGRSPAVKSVKKQVAEILKGQYMKDLIPFTIETRGKFPTLSFEINGKYLEELAQKVFGKTILFTDNHSWKDEEIVASFWDK